MNLLTGLLMPYRLHVEAARDFNFFADTRSRDEETTANYHRSINAQRKILHSTMIVQHFG